MSIARIYTQHDHDRVDCSFKVRLSDSKRKFIAIRAYRDATRNQQKGHYRHPQPLKSELASIPTHQHEPHALSDPVTAATYACQH